jgi:epoxyqueuosine reductase
MLLAEIAGRRGRDRLDATLSREYLSGFDYDSGSRLTGARSVLIVAAPQARLALTFQRREGTVKVVVPPTYSEGTDGEARDRIAGVLETHGYQVVQARLPLKLLAARAGLTEYGRNNITYAERMGSFFRLSAYYTDAPLPESRWGEPRMLVRCRTCSACALSCPTGAIQSDRFLIRAEQCLTFHNERTDPFPEWIDPAWHQCLVGCMDCQNVCPENAPFQDRREESIVFSCEETQQMLEGVRAEEVGPPVREKLTRLCLWDDYEAIARNLRAVFRNPRTATGRTD